MELIRLEDIHKTYHIGEVDLHVLQGVSLRIHRGELVALMGASGSGKSTLMNILGCLDRPSSGKYWLDGQDVSRLSADERAYLRNQKIGFVFQNFNLLPRTSALENVLMPLAYSPQPLSEREGIRRARALLERVGLGDRLDHEPSQLSGGQQQRVAIARALVNHPSILFADEPTGNLDSRSSEEILRMFEELSNRDGLTIILVTHDAGVAGHARRVIRIRDGRIEDGAFEAGPPPDVSEAVTPLPAAPGEIRGACLP
jgi:ABC-type lipoprotein export system ATPase subunit